MTQSSNGQRPANPHRFAIWRAKPFPDGRPPTAEFSISTFIPLDVIRQLYDAIASGTITPEQDRNGVPGVQLWGSGYRGTGAPTASGGTSPVMSGTFNTHKALWQAQQAAQQPPVAPAYAEAFPPQAAPALAPLPAGTFPQPRVSLPGEPAPAPAPAAAPQGWPAQSAAPAANQWASQPPAF
jgi:hypothetical protein